MKIFNWNNENIIGFTTTKSLGNMAFQVTNNPDEVINNRKTLKDLLDIELDHIVFTHQSHSDITLEVTKDDISKGTYSFESGVPADSLYTKDKDLAIGVFHADCVPIFLYHPSGLVGIIHAGFIGTLKHIAYKSIKYIVDKENINPNEFKAYIGPCRKLHSYEINDEEKQLIIQSNASNFILEKDNVYKFDMPSSNILDLIKSGIPLENIENSNIDTVTTEECFSAYKKTPVGRMVSIIKLK